MTQNLRSSTLIFMMLKIFSYWLFYIIALHTVHKSSSHSTILQALIYNVDIAISLYQIFIVIYSNCMYAMSTTDWVLSKCDKLNNNFDIELLKSTKTLNEMLCCSYKKLSICISIWIFAAPVISISQFG